MIDERTLIRLKEQAGISRSSYALKQLVTEGEILESSDYPAVEDMIGPYKMPSGDVKYFDKRNNIVVEAKDVFPKMDKPEKLENPMDNVDDTDDADERSGKDETQAHVMDYPKEVKDSVSKRIKELEETLDTYGDKGYNDNPGALPNAVEALYKIDDHLKEKNLESYKEAQIFFQTLMSPIVNLLPAKLILLLMGDFDTMMRPSKDESKEVKDLKKSGEVLTDDK